MSHCSTRYKNSGLFLMSLLSLGARGAEINDGQNWWNITAVGAIHRQNELIPFKYWLEGQERFGDYNRRSSQRFVRPGLGYTLNETTSIWLGYAWIYTGIPLTTTPFTEQRIWQQLLWVKRYPQLTLSSRTRLEQRFLDNNPKTAWRLREMIKMVSPLANYPKLSVIGSDEVFWHQNNFVGQNNKGLDQNRFFAGLGYKVNSSVTIESGYLNQFIHRRGADNFLAQAISTTLSLNFN
jgi:hypothetical protein